MTDKKGIAYYKDWIYIILFALTIISFTGKMALITDQVKRNTIELKNADLKVTIYKLNEIEEKVDKLTDLVQELITQ